MKEKIYQAIKEKNEKSGYHNGYGVAALREIFQLSYQEIAPLLNELFQEGKIEIRKGLNYELLFAKRK